MQKSPIKVGALIPYPVNIAPGQRYRIEQWEGHLRSLGITVEMLPFVDETLMRALHQPGRYLAKAMGLARCFLRRIQLLGSLRKYEAIYLFRTASIVGPALLEYIFPLLRRPVIFDFDDAIYLLHTSAANRYFGWLKFPGKTAALCRLSSHVIVGNGYLAEYAQQYNRQVTIIPSSVDTDAFTSKTEKESQSRVIVGWTGSSTSQTHLEGYTPLLRELMKQRDIELHVISDRQPDMPGVPVVWHRWSPETEIADMARFDIGIMPMPDDQWSLGKCSMKALLYMAMGIPTICSAIGMNKEVIQHGENGLLAKTDDEWLEGLKMLIDDATLRRRLGVAGRQTIEERYSMRRCAALFATVIRDTVAKHKMQKEVKSWFLQKSKNNAQ